jgi:glycosyltransferase involved in cell wall biosynthesis
MKTLFILSIASGYGGAERSIETILQHLPADISLRIYAESPLHIERLTSAGVMPKGAQLVKIMVTTQTVWGRRLAALRLAMDIRKYQPEVLLVNTHSSALVVAMAAKLFKGLGTRCTLYIRDFLWRDLDFIFERLSGARVITPNQVVTKRIGYLTPYYLKPFGSSSFAVVPDMVNIPFGEVSYEGPLLHLATINAWKGHVDLILALHTLKLQGCNIKACSLGAMDDRPLQRRLQKLVSALDLTEGYALHSYVPDPDPWLRCCRAVVVPSVSHTGGPEAFGRAIIEAWAYGKPVIAYACGASAELIEDEVDGLLVQEGDVEGLASAINRLYSHPELALRLGRAGYAKVQAKYESTAVTRQLLDHLYPTGFIQI